MNATNPKIHESSPQLGLSSTKQAALEFVKQHSDYIFSRLGQIPYITTTVDWGLSRGQGKRTGGMVKGGMCTLMGAIQYQGVDMSSFTELMNDPNRCLILQDGSRRARYAGAFNGGCNHLEAMGFAINPNLTSM